LIVRCQISKPSWAVSTGCVWERREVEVNWMGALLACRAWLDRSRKSFRSWTALPERANSQLDRVFSSVKPWLLHENQRAHPTDKSSCGLHVTTSADMSVDGADDSQSGSQSMFLLSRPPLHRLRCPCRCHRRRILKFSGNERAAFMGD